MNWSKPAEQAVSRVPFFIRPKVRKRVEATARQSGAQEVRLHHVQVCQREFLQNMANEVKGFQVEGCFGLNDCPNRAVPPGDLVPGLERMLARKELKRFLQEKVAGPLKMHHELRISVAECPNACSRPQIVDVGLIGASRPRIDTRQVCNHCAACVEVCREQALDLTEDSPHPAIRYAKCVCCGQCTTVCTSGTLHPERTGYRILIGGKLGRHPQLGRELSGIHSAEAVLTVVEKYLDHYMKHNLRGERFADTLAHSPLDHDRQAEYEPVARVAVISATKAAVVSSEGGPK